MKRLLFLCFFIITSSFLRIEASANSAPTYLRGKAASEILFVDKDCPVEVVHENLTFNMNEEINSPKQGLAKVIAEYGMINKENKEITVQMAFPFISKATELNEEDIIVKTQGGKLPYRLLSGKTLEYNHTDKEEEPVNPYDFENILKDINSSNQENKLIKENTVGKLYTVKISQGNEIYAAVSLIYDPLKTKIIARGFNEGTFLPQGSTLTSFYRQGDVLEFLVLGEDPEFEIKGYKDYKLSKLEKSFSYEVSSKEVRAKDYLMDMIKGEPKISELLSSEELFKIVSQAVEQGTKNRNGVSKEKDILSALYNERIFVLIYETSFAPGEEKKISVEYKALGTMDKTETRTPVYRYDYILNPARNWRSFKDFTLTINTSKEQPYVIESTIDLKKQGERQYKSVLEELPKEDLIFSVYKNESINDGDKVKKNIERQINPGAFLLSITGVISVVVLFIYIITGNKSKKH